MRKSTLLGGIARIVREPSREEMRNAMLRRLGAGHILEADAGDGAQDGTASGDTPAVPVKRGGGR